jgi:enamine deaminase RidA (YjgF/YER057c/UK114 family)
MQNRKQVSSGTIWEDKVGYSRAIRTGNTIEVSGTTAIDEYNKVVGLEDAFVQTCYIIEKAETAIKSLGGSLSNVVRTRIFTTDISLWESIGKAHGKYFERIKPVTTMVEVSRLIEPELLVEIEFTAVIE